MHSHPIIAYTNTHTNTHMWNSHTPTMAMGPKRKPQTTRTHNSGKAHTNTPIVTQFHVWCIRIGKQNPNLSYQIYWRSFCVFNVPHTHKRKVKITFNRQKSNFFNYIRMWAIVRVKCLFFVQNSASQKKKSLLLSPFSVDSPDWFKQK